MRRLAFLTALALGCATGGGKVNVPPAAPAAEAPPPAVAQPREAITEMPERKEFEEPESRLDEAVRAILKQGFVHLRRTVVKMESFQGLEVTVDAAHCYAFFVRLGRGAAFSPVARRGLLASFTLPDGAQLGEFSLTVAG